MLTIRKKPRTICTHILMMFVDIHDGYLANFVVPTKLKLFIVLIIIVIYRDDFNHSVPPFDYPYIFILSFIIRRFKLLNFNEFIRKTILIVKLLNWLIGKFG